MDQRHAEYERLIAPMETRMIRTIWGIVRDPDEAPDALQEALATVWRRWERLQCHPNPEALVLRICVNAAYDALRRKHRRLRRSDPGEAHADPRDPAPSAHHSVVAAEARARIRRAIASLSRNQATAIVLYAVGEVPYERVAATMHCREVTVRTHVARARAKLRALLADLVSPDGEREKGHA